MGAAKQTVRLVIVHRPGIRKTAHSMEANFAWIFACYWNGVNSNFGCMKGY